MKDIGSLEAQSIGGVRCISGLVLVAVDEREVDEAGAGF